jgi:hypothetical protein
MTYKIPFRFTILHFEQRFLIDDVTFIRKNSSRSRKKHFHHAAKALIIPVHPIIVQYYRLG